MPNDKKFIRRNILAEREQRRASDAFSRLESKLNENVAAWLSDQPETVIGGYCPIRSEANILPSLLKWRNENLERALFLPVTHSKTMVFRKWDPAVPLKIGPFGVPQPVASEETVPPLLLIPCVAVDPFGYRLGYGGGFYDRYFAQHENGIRRIGICLSCFTQRAFETEPFDAKLHAVITEKGIRFF